MKKVYVVCRTDYEHTPAFVVDDKDAAEILQKSISDANEPLELPFITVNDAQPTFVSRDIDKDFEVVDDNE